MAACRLRNIHWWPCRRGWASKETREADHAEKNEAIHLSRLFGGNGIGITRLSAACAFIRCKLPLEGSIPVHAGVTWR